MKKTTTLLKTITTLFIALCCYTATAQWAAAPKFPGGRTDAATAFSIDGKMYVAGGLGAKTLWQYDPVANTWKAMADIGGGLNRAWSASFVINGKAYVVGGSYATASDVTDDVQEYDPVTDTWTTKAKIPGGGRDGMYSFVIGNKGYVGGGFNGTATVSGFYEYDPATDKWTQKATSPLGATIFSSGFAVGNKGYVTSGSPGGSSQIKTLYQYDPVTDIWTKKADFPGTARQAGFSFATDTEGFYGGGMSDYNTTYKDIWKYEPQSDTWTKLNDITYEYTAWAFATIVGGKAYVGTGARFTSTLEFTDEMYRYELPTSVNTVSGKTEQVQLFPNPAQNTITVSGVEILSATITDVTGRVVKNINATGNTINIAELNKGVYFLQMVSNEGLRTQRFVKQ